LISRILFLVIWRTSLQAWANLELEEIQYSKIWLAAVSLYVL